MSAPSPDPGAPQYVVARLRERLAADPRTAELAVDVRVHGGDVGLAPLREV